ncbi:MAG: adenylosuccinate synthase [Candidatus Marinimicrobia bacterium]|nr:adenylosuccinate synthase [Candidatus Neomarinimicrobiota bacterium]
MAITSIIGGQWGDEGKGKIVDILSDNVDIVARFQGGANAGHTVIIQDQKIILHQIPSGILHPECHCVMGGGMVVDPVELCKEVDMLHSIGVSTTDRLYLSLTAHIVTPIQKAIDRSSEESSGQRIGTTCRGIGPTYTDKFNRIGIRAHDLMDVSILKSKIESRISRAEDSRELTTGEIAAMRSELDHFYQCAKECSNLVQDTFTFLHSNIQEGKNIIIEGAQGSLLDIDHGTYPFVTSSSPNLGGITTGLGVPVSLLDRRIGIFKAYTTRVGKGPFPTELHDEAGEKLGEIGKEFGATTGRSRRCGWFDGVAGKYSCLLNGFTDIALTKLDVLDYFDEIKVCVAYIVDGVETRDFSQVIHRLEDAVPVYETLAGWNNSVAPAEHSNDLSKRANQYIQFLEELLNTPIKFVSNGPERSQIIVR